MKFSNFLLRVDGVREATLEDCREVVDKGPDTYIPEHQKNIFVIKKEICEDRFFWMSCNYDEADRYCNYVVNRDTGEMEANPRRKSQIEPRQQFFACFDTKKHFLYLNDSNRRPFLQRYLSETTGRSYSINNVYASVDEFCSRIKSIRGFKYTQVDSIFSRNGDTFKQIGDIFGLDLPSSVQLKIGCGDIPIRQGRGLIDRFHKHKEEFESVIILGCDDAGVEQTFDFSSVLKHIQIEAHKDNDEQYNPTEVKTLLLEKLR